MVVRKKFKRPVPPGAKPARRASTLDDLEPVAPKPKEVKAAIAKVETKKQAIVARDTFQIRAAEVRSIAAHEFITDADSRTVVDWWKREDRPYRALVKLGTFQDWATEDKWIERRERFWLEIENRLLEDQKHKVLVQRLEELNRMTPASTAMLEYLSPRTDPVTGEILRHPATNPDGTPHPYAGLPIFPLAMPEFDKAVKSFTELHKLLMTKRGEVTSRSETLDKPVPIGALDPASQAPTFTREEIRALAQHAIKMRQPELQGDVLDALDSVEDEDKNDGTDPDPESTDG